MSVYLDPRIPNERALLEALDSLPRGRQGHWLRDALVSGAGLDQPRRVSNRRVSSALMLAMQALSTPDETVLEHASPDDAPPQMPPPRRLLEARPAHRASSPGGLAPGSRASAQASYEEVLPEKAPAPVAPRRAGPAPAPPPEGTSLAEPSADLNKIAGLFGGDDDDD